MATPSKRDRERIKELADGAAGVAAELVDLMESWDETDKDERDELLQEIETTLGELVDIGERASGFVLAISE